jgi:hypothetical protein
VGTASGWPALLDGCRQMFLALGTRLACARARRQVTKRRQKTMGITSDHFGLRTWAQSHEKDHDSLSAFENAVLVVIDHIFFLHG